MRKIILVGMAALLLSSTLLSAAYAGEETIYAAPGATYFSVDEQIGELDVFVTAPRYARPTSFLQNFEIPDLAGAPVPVDPVSLVGPYAPGSLVVEERRSVAVDAKGMAHLDRRPGAVGRMAW